MKYLKVIKEITSDADTSLQYKINEVISQQSGKNAKTPEDMGEFNFSTEKNIKMALNRRRVI